MGKVAKVILKLILFVVCVALIVMGQKHIGIPGLVAMLVGLAGLLAMLFSYNKKYA